MKNFPRMYVVSSNKLNKGKAVAQSCHAIAAFQMEHPEAFKQWNNYYIVCIKGDLEAVAQKYEELGIKPNCSEYREPDMDNQVTARTFLALNTQELLSCESLCKDLPLV